MSEQLKEFEREDLQNELKLDMQYIKDKFNSDKMFWSNSICKYGHSIDELTARYNGASRACVLCVRLRVQKPRSNIYRDEFHRSLNKAKEKGEIHFWSVKPCLKAGHV